MFFGLKLQVVLGLISSFSLLSFHPGWLCTLALWAVEETKDWQTGNLGCIFALCCKRLHSHCTKCFTNYSNWSLKWKTETLRCIILFTAHNLRCSAATNRSYRGECTDELMGYPLVLLFTYWYQRCTFHIYDIKDQNTYLSCLLVSSPLVDH